MKRAWQAADRAAEMLATARGWRAAGLIDEVACAAISAGLPAAGPRLGPIWRILVFVCVLIGVSTATVVGFISFGLREASGVALALLIFGAALAIVTDVVIDRCSFQPTGAEAATSLLAVGYLCAAVYVLFDEMHLPDAEVLRLTYPWCAALSALAAWRWGFRLYAGVAALFVLLLSAQLPGANLAWIAVAALLAAGAGVAAARREIAPSHRKGMELVRVVALAAIYVALNYYSVDKGFLWQIGHVDGAHHWHAGGISLMLAGIGSVVYPLAIIIWGLRARDRSLLVVGIAAAALSLTTMRFYVHVAPLWVVLVAAGAALAGASLLLERWLRSGTAAERFGFTAAPLCDDARRERLLSVAAALAFAPAARAIPEKPAGIDGGEGTFGGGGAGGSF